VLAIAAAVTLAGCGKLTANGASLYGEPLRACLEGGVPAQAVTDFGVREQGQGRDYEYTPQDTDAVISVARQSGLNLARIRNGTTEVPRVFATALPADFGSDQPEATRKFAFVAIVLPLVLHANEEIERDRRLVNRAARCPDGIGPANGAAASRIAGLHEEYGTGGDHAALLRRLDVVPPSIVIAQAAIATDWGASRLAWRRNTLFGRRSQEATGVTAVPSVMASVRAHIRMLNIDPAFTEFRDQRAKQRRVADRLYGPELSQTLAGYSRRGDAYVLDLRTFILGNAFDQFDQARLADGTPMPLAAASGPRIGDGG